jgi:hypothetical protein
MRRLTFLLLVVLSAACGRFESMVSPTQPSTPISALFSGMVYETSAAGRLPVAEVEVTWCDQNACRPERVLTGPDGRYTMQAVGGLGYAYLKLQKDGYRPEQSARTFSSGSVELDVQLNPNPRPSRLFGLVYEVTADGNIPVAGAHILLCDDFLCSDWVETATGADGRYQFDFAEWSGSISISVSKDGYYSHWARIEIVGHREYNVLLGRK